MTQREALLAGLKEIIRVESVDESTPLGAAWDSLAVVMALSLIDEVCDRSVKPAALEACATAGDVLKLCEPTP